MGPVGIDGTGGGVVGIGPAVLLGGTAGGGGGGAAAAGGSAGFSVAGAAAGLCGGASPIKKKNTLSNSEFSAAISTNS